MKQLDSEQQRVMREAYERVFGWSGPSLSHDPLYAAGAALLESQDERIADLKYLLRNAIEYFELVQRGIKLPLTFAGQLKQYRAAVEAQCPAPAEGAKVEARHMISVVHPTTEEYRDRRKELMFKLNFIDEALPQLKEEAERDPCYPHPAAPRAESQDTVPRAVAERIVALEAERDEFNAGWKSCIEDLRKGAEIRRAVEAENAQLRRVIAALKAPVSEARTMETRPCVSCAEQTVYSCIFDRMPLCGEIKCREQHERRDECSGHTKETP